MTTVNRTLAVLYTLLLLDLAIILSGLPSGTAQAAPPAQAPDTPTPVSNADPERNGLLKGQVINVTTNNPQGNVEVTLHVIGGETEVETFTAQADSQGNYAFENLAVDHTLQYVVEGRYQDIAYFSDQPALFVPDSDVATLNLNVYETTTDDEAIGVTRLHYLVAFGPNAVQAAQIYVLENRGTQAYIGQNGETFSFLLPQAATNVAFENDFEGRFVRREKRYADTAPIMPGQDSHSILARYDIPYAGDSLTIEVPITSDIPAVTVIVQDIGAGLSSDQLRFVETREGHGDKFSIFSGDNLRPGDILTLELTDLDELDFSGGLDDASSTTVPDSQVDQALLRWVLTGLGGLVIIVIGVVYPLVRPQLTRQTNAHDEDPDFRRQRLLLMLARLDEVFEAGNLDEGVYRRARARYKAELAELLKN